jgi:hydrogenase nickel incorporation protein HypA/HybF
MHEMGIANSVLEAVRTETARLNGQHASKVGMRIGELAAVDPEALHFCFDALVCGTDLEPLELEIEFCPRKHRCPRCEKVFPVVDYAIECPQCGSPQTEFVSGDELELAYLEVADHEPLATGR